MYRYDFDGFHRIDFTFKANGVKALSSPFFFLNILVIMPDVLCQ